MRPLRKDTARAGAADEGVVRARRLLLEGLAARMAPEPRRRLLAQLDRSEPVSRRHGGPQVSVYVPRDGGTWPSDVLFPRREELVLATVGLRVDGKRHEGEVVAVHGRIFALVIRPPVGNGPGWVKVEGVRLGADPMTTGSGAPPPGLRSGGA